MGAHQSHPRVVYMWWHKQVLKSLASPPWRAGQLPLTSCQHQHPMDNSYHPGGVQSDVKLPHTISWAEHVTRNWILVDSLCYHDLKGNPIYEEHARFILGHIKLQ